MTKLSLDKQVCFFFAGMLSALAAVCSAAFHAAQEAPACMSCLLFGDTACLSALLTLAQRPILSTLLLAVHTLIPSTLALPSPPSVFFFFFFLPLRVRITGGAAEAEASGSATGWQPIN